MKFKNIIVYSKKLPPEFIGGIETNGYHLIKHLSELSDLRMRVVSYSNEKRPRIFPSKKALQTIADCHKVNVIDKYDMTNFKRLHRHLKDKKMCPEETVIYHNTLDLHHYYSDLKAAGYHQIARSGGNDIFYLKKKNDSHCPFHDNLHYLDKLLLNSEYSRRRCIKEGLNEDLTAVIKGGCEKVFGSIAPATNKISKSPVILTCGRIVDFKGLEDAIEALSVVKNQGGNFTYLIIGSGELQTKIEELIAKKGLTENCNLLGKLSPEETQRYYKNADIYLSTSKDIQKQIHKLTYTHTETMGRSICEAQINGTPVIATDAGGVPEMILHEQTGLLVQQGNIKEIAAALQKLISDEPLRLKYAKNAEHHAANEFSWDTVIDKTIKEINMLAD